MDLLTDITLGAAVTVGILLIGGLLFVANARDVRNARHPGGVSGRLKDEAIVLGPMLPMLCMLGVGSLVPGLRDAGWWFPVLLAAGVGGAACSFAPVVRDARRRLSVLRGEPAQ